MAFASSGGMERIAGSLWIPDRDLFCYFKENHGDHNECRQSLDFNMAGSLGRIGLWLVSCKILE